jgi:hypothetical protein
MGDSESNVMFDFWMKHMSEKWKRGNQGFIPLVAVHRIAGTPHVSASAVESFCLAAVASAFSLVRHAAGSNAGRY